MDFSPFYEVASESSRIPEAWINQTSGKALASRLRLASITINRSGRQGFPAVVIAELMLLHSRNSKRLPAAKQDVWSQTLSR